MENESYKINCKEQKAKFNSFMKMNKVNFFIAKSHDLTAYAVSARLKVSFQISSNLNQCK